MTAALLGLVALTLHARADVPAPSPADPPFQDVLKPFLAAYCYDCHGREKQRAEVDLERLPAGDPFAAQGELWEKVRHVLASHEMPPDNRRQPSQTERQAIVDGIRKELDRVESAQPPHPGAVTLRRLNRNEYRNTIRDLVGIDFDPSASFPHDESGYGFDNIGDVLSLPPMLFEKYLAAAEEITARAIVTEDPALRRARRVPAERFTSPSEDIARREDDTVWGLYREGRIATEQDFEQAGDYRLRLGAFGEQAGPELPRMEVLLDGRSLHVQSVRAIAGNPETFEVPVRIAAGRHRFEVGYLNNFNTDGDRNVFLTAFEIVGPLGVPLEEYPEVHRRIIPRRATPGEEKAYAAEILRGFATRAFRRPATEDEVQRLVGLAGVMLQEGERFERAIQHALQAVLVSPHFLYRWELDPQGMPAGTARPLNDYEIASRLSYFLWSSMPDDALFADAAAERLSEPGVLEGHVRRMLRDPKAEALVRHFGGQWLQIRNLDQAEPDPTVFPAWDEALRQAMQREAELFLWAILQEDRSIRDLIRADFTFVNERLARHYGIEGVQGEAFQRVSLPPGSDRGGVLTLGGVLTVTSVPTRTAPVLRGKWVLEQILGTPPPPPPPNVPPIPEGAEAVQAATLRQRLELHRNHPDCMTCHQKMDPLGFALEGFDAIGARRETDGPHPVDTSAELPNGRTFDGASGLKEVLQENDAFPRAFVSKLLTYALGRGLEPYDRRVVQAIVERAGKNGFKFSSLVLEIVASDPFLKRQPEFAAHEPIVPVHP